MPLRIQCDARLSHDVRDRVLKSQAKAIDLYIRAPSHFSPPSYCVEGSLVVRSEEQNAPRQVPNHLLADICLV